MGSNGAWIGLSDRDIQTDTVSYTVTSGAAQQVYPPQGSDGFYSLGIPGESTSITPASPPPRSRRIPRRELHRRDLHTELRQRGDGYRDGPPGGQLPRHLDDGGTRSTRLPFTRSGSGPSSRQVMPTSTFGAVRRASTTSTSAASGSPSRAAWAGRQVHHRDPVVRVGLAEREPHLRPRRTTSSPYQLVAATQTRELNVTSSWSSYPFNFAPVPPSSTAPTTSSR